MDSSCLLKNDVKHSAQRIFFQWAVKWFYTQIIEDTSSKPDVPNLVMLLQAVGFHLREFEKQDLTQEENAPAKESIKVTIKCGTSKMRAVLEMDGVDCQCPNEVKDGSLWSICGHAPNSNDSIGSSKYEETGSNLLPTIPKEVNNVARDVVYRLFKIMNNPSAIASAKSGNDLDLDAIGNVDNSSDNHEGLSRSHTQPNFSTIHSHSINNNKFLPTKNTFNSKLNESVTKFTEDNENDLHLRRKSLQRQKTWDMELESTSPKITSSPTSIDHMSNSLGHISLRSEDDSGGFIDYVLKAYDHLDKAVNFLTKKAPITSSTLSLNDHSFVKPTPPPAKSIANSSMSSKGSSRLGSVSSVPSRRRTIALTTSPFTRKLTEKSALPKIEVTKTPTRQNSPLVSSIPKKAIPSRLSTPRCRSSSISAMNSSAISDKTSLTKTFTPPLTKKVNTLGFKRPSLAANTSLQSNSSLKSNTSLLSNTSLRSNTLNKSTLIKTPTSVSKLTPPTSISNAKNRFGFPGK